MKIFKLDELSKLSDESFFEFGTNEHGVKGLNIVFGTVASGGTKEVSSEFLIPTAGRSAIFYLLKGNLTIQNDKIDFTTQSGEAFVIKENESFSVINNDRAEVSYILFFNKEELLKSIDEDLEDNQSDMIN